ncbi:MAG: YdcF family protein [Candidatus Saccharimonadales bacterium]
MLIRIIVTFICILAIGIVTLNLYLSPDALRDCDTPRSEGKCQKADAIVAVSGGNTSVRATEAILLYQGGWSDYLIFSGAAKDTTGPSNAEVMKQQALMAGVPDSAIIIEDTARTTHQNAEQTEGIISQYHIERLIVVTSPYHQRRAGLEFAKRVGNGVTIVNHPAKGDTDWPWYWWVTPRGWWLAGGEVAKIVATHAGGSE